MESTLVQAREYLQFGLSVISLRPRGKEPVGPWKEFQNRRASEAEVRRWFAENENNIGIVTGAISGIFVVDVDIRHGGDKSLEDRERNFAPLPITSEVDTGGGGRHLFLRHPGRLVPNSAGAVAPGIDIRGDGGFVVAPPSVHPSGSVYRWRGERSLHDLEPAQPPEWLLNLMRRVPQSAERSVKDRWRGIYSSEVAEGSRNETVARLAGHLLRHRIDPYVVLALVSSWNHDHCRPPLSVGEVARVVDSIAKSELARRAGRRYEH